MHLCACKIAIPFFAFFFKSTCVDACVNATLFIDFISFNKGLITVTFYMIVSIRENCFESFQNYFQMALNSD